MLRFPDALTPERFLAGHWQKQALFLPQATNLTLPTISADELGWLATQDDVESRLIFVDRSGESSRYRAETGPFDEETLQNLPTSDWTLLVHDVEKHLPDFRAYFELVPFIPEWRIDDLMISFAAPGGGVGPHLDNYDVFLVQSEGTREWRFTDDLVVDDPAASNDIALLQEFEGNKVRAGPGDILYLPPGVAHWGTALDNCVTCSIGMRAPQISDLTDELPDEEASNPFYTDTDLGLEESASKGKISKKAAARAAALTGRDEAGKALGRSVTETKEWITPECDEDDVDALVEKLKDGVTIPFHGMSRFAYDEENVYVNGRAGERYATPDEFLDLIARNRSLNPTHGGPAPDARTVEFMLKAGLFDLPEHL